MKCFFKKPLILLALLLVPAVLNGQTTAVSGTVVDSSGEALPGVSIFEEGTRNGVISDINGHYSLTVKSPSATVNFSCIGFQTRSFAASELRALNRVVLEDDTIMLEDAVAIGYGTVKKEDLTGSVTAIKAEEINRGIVTSTDELLKGKLTGVQIIPGGGAPGSSGIIRIRGAASLNASNDPLIVVDGVPLAHGNLSMINPNDIESFSILKDASASAIYGSRASNGVIMVTTKKGQPGQKLRVSYTGSFSLKQNPSRIDTMSPDEFKSTLRDYYTTDVYNRFVGTYETDWQGLVLQTAYNTEHNISLSGSAWKAPYRVSLNFNHDEGTIKNSWNNRGSIAFSTAPTFFDDHLKISLNGRMTISDGYSANVLQNAAFFNPTMPPYFYNADGSIDYTTARGFFGYGVNRGSDFQPDAQAWLHAVNPLSSIYDTTRSGLSVIKKYVEMHGGHVSVDSDEGGTTFTFVLPGLVDTPAAPSDASAAPGDDSDKPLVAIVDDNAQICTFIESLLRDRYRCVSSHNGRSGLKLCQDVLPDLVISDVVMPVMDGLTMCRQLRGFGPLADIPIILLTAKGDRETEKKSLDLRVDVFLPKPFEVETLTARVDQLLTGKKRMEHRLRMELLTAPSATRELSPDERYLQKATQLIEEHLDDPDLTVSRLCELGDFNEKQLYRKIKQFTGLSVIEYIRSIRLKKAALLLQSGNYTVSEVLYSVGFSNASYFSRAFAAVYHMTPSEYMKSFKKG